MSKIPVCSPPPIQRPSLPVPRVPPLHPFPFPCRPFANSDISQSPARDEGEDNFKMRYCEEAMVRQQQAKLLKSKFFPNLSSQSDPPTEMRAHY